MIEIKLSQKERLKLILQDGCIHTVPELIKAVYGLGGPSSARLAARICDLRKDGYTINSDSLTATKWWYQMVVKTRLKFKPLVDKKGEMSKRTKLCSRQKELKS